MKLINVYIEHLTLQLNQLFTYACDEPVQKGCRVKVDFAHRECIGFVQETDVKSDLKNIKPVLEVIDKEPLLNEELLDLAQYISKRYVCSVISAYKTMLPPALRPSSTYKKIIYEDHVYLSSSTLPLTSKQANVYEEIKDKLPMKASEFRKLTKSLAKPLIEKGYVELRKLPKSNDVLPSYIEDSIHELTLEQKNAIEEIENSNDSCFLLHGVTGSGKTEVFLHLAQTVLKQNKQVLFLVPEIGLTPMMIERVMARFQRKVAIYHSQLNDQEKYEQYCLVKDKKVDIVIGTRSAAFMPFDDLGLILMDEEHDTSYKQDSMPRYHTRDIALWRAKYHGCKVVLSSATPSLESYSRAYKNVYHLVSLTKRIYDQMPEIHLVDMKEERNQFGLSQRLIDAIQKTLDKNDQVILLLNRRGYLPVVRCSNCNEVMMCPDCGIALTYHKSNDSLMCHCCGNVYRFDHTCPKCHSHHFFQVGMGTERLEENIQMLFPNANIVRMDADSTKRKNAHAKLLKEFEQSGDILLGTQMVAKGLDFERVTLVGILQADNALIHSDYRSCEIAYQMLEQASGRSGRGVKKGDVYIQTYDPGHYVMQSVLKHDYLGFFRKEMSYRHLGVYPPYVFLCCIIYSHESLEKAMNVALLGKQFLSQFKVLGPLEINMRQRQKRVRLIVKSKDETQLNQTIWKLVEYHRSLKTNVKQDINMYPLILEE